VERREIGFVLISGTRTKQSKVPTARGFPMGGGFVRYADRARGSLRTFREAYQTADAVQWGWIRCAGPLSVVPGAS